MSQAHLFSPLRLRGLTLRNRIAVSPMCQYSSQESLATDWHLVHLGAMARGGAGLVLTEATAVSPEGRISPHDLGLWSEAHAEALGRINRFVHDQGAAVGVQLAHAGRKASTFSPWVGAHGAVPEEEGGWRPVGPGEEPFASNYTRPVALDEEGLRRVVSDFRQSAKWALSAAFDIVEIHAAHGYLLHEFLSPLTNHRGDAFGGDFEGRTRLLREVVRGVREVWPEERPLFVRVSATDWTEGGWSLQDTVRLARQLTTLGVDLIDCSSGGAIPGVQAPVGPGYQVPFAQALRGDGVASGAVGLITTPEQADTIVRTGQADLILLGRAFLRDPHWPLAAAQALGEKIEWPKPYRSAARGH